MKINKIFYFISILSIICSCTDNRKHMELQGTVEDEILNNKKVYLFEKWDKADSTIITDKKFSFKTEFDSVQVYNIGIEDKRNFNTILADQSSIVTIHYNKGGYSAEINDNGGSNSIFTNLLNSIRDFQVKEGMKLKKIRQEKASKEIIDSILQVNRTTINEIWRNSAMTHAYNLAGAAILSEYHHLANTKEFLSFYDHIKYSHLFPQLKDRKQICENKDKTKEGAMFVDFQGMDIDGKDIALSDFVGKGKYVLVDFWASWCGPCRAEIPNIINVYKKFAGDKFMVIGVDLWDQEEKFKKAVEEEKIEYPQIFGDKDNKAGVLYGIESIPHIILFEPDGKILKRGLRGEAIAKTVEEALKK